MGGAAAVSAAASWARLAVLPWVLLALRACGEFDLFVCRNQGGKVDRRRPANISFHDWTVDLLTCIMQAVVVKAGGHWKWRSIHNAAPHFQG